MFQLSVCEGTVFPNLPFRQRVREVAAAGFSVELWGWEEEALDAIAADPDIQIASMPGWGAGSMVHPDGVATFLEGARRNLSVARRIGCRNLAVASGELDREGRVVHAIAEHPADLWITAYRCLCELAEIAEKEDVSYNFEVLNTKVDHAGYPFPHLEDGARLIRQVNSPRVRLLEGIAAVHKPEMWGGGHQAALGHFQAAIELFADDEPETPLPAWGHAEAHAWIGQTYAALGKVDEARAAYERALEVAPGYAWVRDVLMPYLGR